MTAPSQHVRRALAALQAVRAALRPMPHYPAAALASLLMLCAVDSFTIAGTLPPAYLFYLPPLAAFVGACLGVVGLLAFTLGRHLPIWLTRAAWPLAGLGVGLALANALGAFARLGTRYDELAKYTLAGCLVGGLMLGALCLSMQPSTRRPDGFLGSLGRPMRIVLALLLLIAIAALVYADRTLYVGLYREGHLALRIISLLLSSFALLLLARELRLPAIDWRGGLALFVLALVPAFGLQKDSAYTIHAFIIRPWPTITLRMARGALDIDRDGYSALLGGGDCNDFNSDINPGAQEVPDNGIDDNCLLGDRKSSFAKAETIPVPEQPSPMNVILITVDTLRADRLGIDDPTFGPDGLDTMPKVRAWAKDAVRFHHAFTPGAWTSVAMGSLMRGIYPRKLTWEAYYETNKYRMVRRPSKDTLAKGEKAAKMFPLSWNDPREPLAHWLQRRGMRTVGVVDDGFSQMLSRLVGTQRGFDLYHEVNPDPEDKKDLERRRKTERRPRRRKDSTTATIAIREMRRADQQGRFFLWVHFFGPHLPNSKHKNVRSDGESQSQMYDHEIRVVDQHVGRVLEAADTLQTPTAIIFTSDHGERFAARYRSHGANLQDGVLQVPLLARVPGWPVQDIQAAVSLVDLMPTILSLTETPAPPWLDGIDLGQLAGGKPAPKRLLLSDTWQYNRKGERFNDRTAAYDGKRKVVLDRIDHSFSVYDQQRSESEAVRLEGMAIDDFARTILGYIEDAGEMKLE
ncbi:MAG: sulfatase-like hydrolase/transferase [Myxococcales bacterium]|nr:sulfatase-like hydrolase/transferase [Myxococcales bacterium]